MGTVKDVVAAILINNENKVLIAQRADSDPLAGFWEFPGGKIEAGESPEQSLMREMREVKHCVQKENYNYNITHLYGRSDIWMV